MNEGVLAKPGTHVMFTTSLSKTSEAIFTTNTDESEFTQTANQNGD